MSFKRIAGGINANTDVSGSYNFTLQFPVGYSELFSASLYPAYSEPSLTIGQALASVVGVDPWTGVTTVQFQGSSGVVSGVIGLVFEMVVGNGDESTDVSTTGYNGTVVQ